MAIETICKGCARKLRVDDKYAGRKARCPHCKTVYEVPAADTSRDRAVEPNAGAGEGWLLRTNHGSVYGPASKSELDDWVREGRVDAASLVRQESEATWRPALELYPSLMTATASEVNPFADKPTTSAPEANPYSSPRAMGSSTRAYQEHRGVLILTLGVLGIVCCQFCSIAAWVMGHADMKEINAGRMDPEGRGLTQAGMIIGIIGTVLFVLGCGAQIIFLMIAIASEM